MKFIEISMKINRCIYEIWQEAFSKRDFKISFFLSILLALSTISLTSKWLLYNESRSSAPLNDWILALFTPLDLNIPIFFFTQTAVVIGLITSALLPYHLIKTLLCVTLIALLRIIAMYFVPLEPPLDIIPLRDPLIEGFFFGGKVIVKDLFFSGHTSNLILLSLITPFNKVRFYLFLSAIVVAIMLMLQHVHYTIDILVVPLFALLAIAIADTIMKLIFKRPIDLSRSKSLRMLFQKST